MIAAENTDKEPGNRARFLFHLSFSGARHREDTADFIRFLGRAWIPKGSQRNMRQFFLQRKPLSLPPSMGLLPRTHQIEMTLGAFHSVNLENANAHAAVLQGLTRPPMTLGTPPRSVHLSCMIRRFQLLRSSPAYTKNVQILPIVLE